MAKDFHKEGGLILAPPLRELRVDCNEDEETYATGGVTSILIKMVPFQLCGLSKSCNHATSNFILNNHYLDLPKDIPFLYLKGFRMYL